MLFITSLSAWRRNGHKTFLYLLEWIGAYISLQLMLMTVAFPVLIAWHLPITPLSLVGNVLFAPLLVSTLACCCLIFFGQFLYLPISWCYPILNWLTDSWLHTLAWMPSCSFCYTPQWYSFPLLVLPCAVLTYHRYYPLTLPYRILLFALILIVQILLHSLR